MEGLENMWDGISRRFYSGMCRRTRKVSQHRNNPSLFINHLISIRSSLHSRAEFVCKDLGLGKAQTSEKGGPAAAMDYMTSIIYASHSQNIFKDFDPRSDLTPEVNTDTWKKVQFSSEFLESFASQKQQRRLHMDVNVPIDLSKPWENLTEDGGVKKQTLVEGTGDKPKQGEKVGRMIPVASNVILRVFNAETR